MSSDAIVPQPEPTPDQAARIPEEAPPRFDTEPYAVSGPTPVLGTLVLLVGLAIAGLAVGLIASVIEQWFNLIILFPIGMGLLVGAAGAGLVKLGKARSPAVILLATVLAAAITMFGLHYGGYLRWLNAVEEAAAMPGLFQHAMLNPRGFVRHVDDEATAGVTIGRPGQKGMNIGYIGTYILWTVEVGIAGWMIFILMHTAAQAPLCEHCQTWKKERTLAHLPAGPPDLVMGPLVDGHLLALLGQASAPGADRLVLNAAICPVCGPESTVDTALVEVTENAKGNTQTKELCRVRYPGKVLKLLDARGSSQ
jgi:hypothetical protein